MRPLTGFERKQIIYNTLYYRRKNYLNSRLFFFRNFALILSPVLLAVEVTIFKENLYKMHENLM